MKQPDDRPPAPLPDPGGSRRYEAGMWTGLVLIALGALFYLGGAALAVAIGVPALALSGLGVVLGLLGFLVFLVKVLRDRARNREDRYYSRNVDQ